MKKRIGINGTIIFLSFVLVILFPAWFMRVSASMPHKIVAVMGVALLLLGLLLRVASRGYKSDLSKNGHALVEGGPYSLVRNPMYLGILCIGTGVVCILFQWWILVLFYAIFLARYYTLILAEEKKLIEVFGRQYEAYRKLVPRLFPRPAAFFRKNPLDYLPLRFRWLKREWPNLILVPSAIVALGFWQSYRLLEEPVSLRQAAGMLAVLGCGILFATCLAQRYETISIQNKRHS